MKQFPTTLTGKYPETQDQLRMTDGQSGSEIQSATPGANQVFIGNHDPFAEDLSDMEQVEYSERPYLADEKWFA